MWTGSGFGSIQAGVSLFFFFGLCRHKDAGSILPIGAGGMYWCRAIGEFTCKSNKLYN